ncbi:MAG TPA: ABC transporter permease [bacterium]|nr:ABC transporter permease [bacterium]
MTRYLGFRVAYVAATLVAVSVVIFVMLMASGDPAALMLSPNATPAEVAALRHQMGFDRPWPAQYLAFVRRAVWGDFGTSLRYNEPALGLVVQFLPATAVLAGAAMALAVAIAMPLGVLAAARRGSAYDLTASAVGVLGQSVPVFWLGMLMILVFGVVLQWLPIGGRGGVSHLVLPAAALGWYETAALTRLVRASLLDVLGDDYIRTAYAKGLRAYTVLLKHALRNAALPVVTVLGLELGTLLGGAVVTETVFSWPGVGRLLVDAVNNRDVPLALTAILLLAGIVICLNLVVDLCYAWLDPRVRYG